MVNQGILVYVIVMCGNLEKDGVIAVDFVHSAQNLVDPSTKGLVRDLMIKTARGMVVKVDI